MAKSSLTSTVRELGLAGAVKANPEMDVPNLLRGLIQFVPPSGPVVAQVRKEHPLPGETVMQEDNKRRRLTRCLSRTMPMSNKGTDSHVTLGLHNPGNFCYRRSVLQSILNIPVVVNWLLLRAESHRQELNTTLSDPQHHCLFCAVANLAQDIWIRRRITSLSSFDQRLRELDPHKMLDWPRSHRQADAHEFLHVLIDYIVDPKHGFNRPAPIAQGLFSLRISRQWTCKVCNLVHTASPVDETGLNLAIVHPKHGNIDDYIRQYFLPEEVEARCENEQCPSNPPRPTKGQRSPILPLRKRTATVASTPEVLFVQFNRFAVKHSSGRHSLPRKERKRVPYSQHLDLSQYVIIGTKDGETAPSSMRYKLTAVVAHQGEKNSGHYIAYVVSPKGTVQEISDASVRNSTMDEMLDPRGGFTPYILTFVRTEKDEQHARNIHRTDGMSILHPSIKPTTNGTFGLNKIAAWAELVGPTVKKQESLSPSPGLIGRLTLNGEKSEESQETRYNVIEEDEVAKASIDFMKRGGHHAQSKRPGHQKTFAQVQKPAWFSHGRKAKFKQNKMYRRK